MIGSIFYCESNWEVKLCAILFHHVDKAARLEQDGLPNLHSFLVLVGLGLFFLGCILLMFLFLLLVVLFVA